MLMLSSSRGLSQHRGNYIWSDLIQQHCPQSISLLFPFMKHKTEIYWDQMRWNSITLWQHTALSLITMLVLGSVGSWVVTLHPWLYAQSALIYIYIYKRPTSQVATSALISHKLSMSSIQTLNAALITLQTGRLLCRSKLKWWKWQTQLTRDTDSYA